MDEVDALDGWLPGRIFWDDADVEASVVEWIWCDTPRFTEAFLDDTFTRLMRHPANALFRRRTTLAELEAWAGRRPGIAPTGFIFHVSRCGSTLLAHLLGRLDGALVLSEPGPVDSLIRAGDRLSRSRRITLLRAMVGALGQARAPGQERLFVKFDAWNTLQHALIRDAFPETPWVFLYRDPVEVLVSALRQRGVHTVPGLLPAALFGIEDQPPGDDYAARVLGAIYAAGLDAHGQAPGLLVDYSQLPGATWDAVAAHFGIAPTTDEIARLTAASGRNPKQGDQPFTADAETKRRSAPEDLRALAEQWMRPAYERLEEARSK
jgi:hypothetical protein